MRSILIVNPFASAVTEQRIEAVVELLPGDVTVRLTEHPGHATELAREACAVADAIFVFSGDGGFNEALNGADGRVPLGFLPGGGTSVLPRALGLPRDAVEAARALAGGRTRRIALGVVNGRRFGFSAGVGFDAELVRRVDELGRRPDGRRPGDLAFTWAAVRALARHRVHLDPVLDVEGLGRAAFALVANCDPYTYAGSLALHVAPEARFDLGLDVVAPRRVRSWTLPRLARQVLRGAGQQRDADIVYGHDLDGFVVRCDEPLPLHVDGEDLGDVTEAVFACERAAMPVLV